MSQLHLLTPDAPAGAVLFDPGAGELIDGALRVALTPLQAAVLGHLHRAGTCVLAKELAYRIYGDSPHEWATRDIATHVCDLRRKLKPTRLRIETRHGFGYRIVVVERGP